MKQNFKPSRLKEALKILLTLFKKKGSIKTHKEQKSSGESDRTINEKDSSYVGEQDLDKTEDVFYDAEEDIWYDALEPPDDNTVMTENGTKAIENIQKTHFSQELHSLNGAFFKHAGNFQKNLYMAQGKSAQGEKYSWPIQIALKLVPTTVKSVILKLQACCDQHHQYNEDKNSNNYQKFIKSLNDAYNAVVDPEFQTSFQSMMNGKIISSSPKTKIYLKHGIISTYQIDESPINVDIAGLSHNMKESLLDNINQDKYFINNNLNVHAAQLPYGDEIKINSLLVFHNNGNFIHADDVEKNFITSLALNILTQKHLAEQTAAQHWDHASDGKPGTHLDTIEHCNSIRPARMLS